MKANYSQTLAQIKTCGLIPIIRGDFSTMQICNIAQVLIDAGINIVEVTLNSPKALEGIAALRKNFDSTQLATTSTLPDPQLVVGAGTVRSTTQFLQALEAGAEFTLSPHCDPAIIELAAAHRVLHIPGALSPTEVELATSIQSSLQQQKLVKLFPIDSLGAKYLKAIAAPLSDVQFIPTGGVGLNNISEYAAIDAVVAVGLGGSLISSPAQALTEIFQKAQQLKALWIKKLRQKHPEQKIPK